MKKIALITIYQVPNYGSVLQAYACQLLFRSAGINCEIINYRYPNEWHLSQINVNSSLTKDRIKKSVKCLIAPIIKLFGNSGSRILQYELENFIRHNFRFTKRFSNYQGLKEFDWSRYDAVAVGSDQVWNYRFSLADKAFMLGFVPDSIKKFSIASSFAVKKLPDSLLSKYENNLSRFQAISVREENGLKILSEELKIDGGRIILDPTLLISRGQWQQAIKPSNKYKGKKYILVYGMYYAFDPKPYIFEVTKHFKKFFDCEVFALSGYKPESVTNGLKMIDVSGSSLNDFIDLFLNADLVVTSSFHGTAFALNFNVPLISIVPDSGDDRQSSLLKLCGADTSIVKIGTDIANINPYYDGKEVQQKLQQIRTENIDWIFSQIK